MFCANYGGRRSVRNRYEIGPPGNSELGKSDSGPQLIDVLGAGIFLEKQSAATHEVHDFQHVLVGKRD